MACLQIPDFFLKSTPTNKNRKLAWHRKFLSIETVKRFSRATAILKVRLDQRSWDR